MVTLLLTIQAHTLFGTFTSTAGFTNDALVVYNSAMQNSVAQGRMFHALVTVLSKKILSSNSKNNSKTTEITDGSKNRGK